MSNPTPREELERIRRVSDSLCTAHAGLKDRYGRYALLLDLLILALSVWLVGLAFAEPELSARLTPFALDSRVWLGVLGVVTFFLTLVQIKTDWKSRSDAHKRTLDLYAEVKREAGYVLASRVDDDNFRRVCARYDLASAVGIGIPESEFLTQKRRHKTKVALSKYLDDHPMASIWLTRVKFWYRDNFKKAGTNA